MSLKWQRGFYRPTFEDWLKDIHIIIAQRCYHLLSKLHDSHFHHYSSIFSFILWCVNPTCVLLYAPAVWVYLCPFFFTVSVFCLTSVAASGGNSLFSNLEAGVFPSLDHVSGTLCLLHYVTETSHLYSLRDFWRHFCSSRAAAHSDCCFFAPCTNILTYLLTYFLLASHPHLNHEYTRLLKGS